MSIIESPAFKDNSTDLSRLSLVTDVPSININFVA